MLSVQECLASHRLNPRFPSKSRRSEKFTCLNNLPWCTELIRARGVGVGGGLSHRHRGASPSLPLVSLLLSPTRNAWMCHALSSNHIQVMYVVRAVVHAGACFLDGTTITIIIIILAFLDQSQGSCNHCSCQSNAWCWCTGDLPLQSAACLFHPGVDGWRGWGRCLCGGRLGARLTSHQSGWVRGAPLVLPPCLCVMTGGEQLTNNNLTTLYRFYTRSVNLLR